MLADSRSPRDGRFLERLGTYDPLLPADDPRRVTLKVERIRYWLDRGAQPTDRVARFLARADLRPAPERRNPIKGRPKAKAQERLKAAAEAAAEAGGAAADG